MIDELIACVAPSILGRSGSIFYSGRRAFTQPSNIYILGLNPGGCPIRQASDTIERDLERIKADDRENWSAYRDEVWEGAPGTHGMQPRVLHLLKRLGRDPGEVPASNVVFVRTRREKDLHLEKNTLLPLCWGFHEKAIEQLGVRAILCFGGTAGTWVREKLGADQCIGQFQENNRRRWTSVAHSNSAGICVATLTHPSIAKWDTPETDPTELVLSVIDQSRPSTR